MLASYIPVETFAENEEYIEEEAFLETIEALPDGGDPADAPERIDDLVSDTEFACELQDDLFEDAEEPELPPEEGIEEDFSDLFSDIPEEETFDGDGAAIENETVMEEAETMADIAPPDPAAAAEITVGSEFMFSGSVETSKMYRFTASAFSHLHPGRLPPM